ncbi:MAG: hypothetical protein Q8P34_06380 [Bacteroidota bacterium]|nr:hypothetical protein [Bacteroidota bacterium]
MKQDRLESFVNENRHEFDQMEPSDKMWDAISNKLNEPPVQKSRKFGWMKVAAVLAVMALIPTILYKIKF